MGTLILVVEDDENSRLLQETMLTSQGYHVHSAEHGKKAVEFLRENDVDLIISDILMPEMDGYALCRFCKSEPRLKHIPFVFYTATYTDTKAEQHAFDVGASKFLLKPMEVNDFLEEIRIVLEQYKAHRLEVPPVVAKSNNELNADYSSILGKKLEKKVKEANEERRRAHLSEETYRKLVEFAPIGIMRVTTDGKLQTVNERMSLMLGYASPEDMLKHSNSYVHIVYHGQKERERLLDLLHKQGELHNEETVFKHVDGSEVWVEVSSRIISDQAGSAVCYEDFVIDITERKHTQEKLILAKESAEAANIAKSEFLANMSHEIRTPLNGVVGMLRLMEATELNTDQKKFNRMALLSSLRLTRLLSDILDLSAMEAGKMDIIMEPFDFKDAIDNVVQLFSSAFMEKKLELKMNINPNISSRLIGDMPHLKQVLNNLVGNAIKFTESGHITIDAHPLPPSTKDEYRVLFSVSDTGIGMPDELIGRLFTPFTQAERSFRRRFQGAGLGLAISKSLVELMGGNMSVVSEEGVGSTFHVCIPFKKAPPLTSL